MKGFLPVPDPIAFRIFGLEIRWYAICIVLGMVVAVIISMLRTHRYGIEPPDKVIDLVIWVLPISIVGARLYYVLFEWDQYKDNPISILYIHQGGLAIHGGLIFGIATAVILALHWKHSPLKWLDLAAPGIAIGQAIGRWGNYFNSEAHGIATDLPWAIEVNGELVHPTFLYESVWCYLLFAFLLFVEKHRKKPFDGQIICLYVIFYSLERFFVEGLRTDSLWIGQYRQAQVFSACAFVLGIVFYFVLRHRGKMLAAKPSQIYEPVPMVKIPGTVADFASEAALLFEGKPDASASEAVNAENDADQTAENAVPDQDDNK